MRTINARDEATVPFHIKLAALELLSTFNVMVEIEQDTQSDNGNDAQPYHTFQTRDHLSVQIAVQDGLK